MDGVKGDVSSKSVASCVVGLVCYPDLGVRQVQDEALYSEQGPPLIGLRTFS